MKKLPVVVLSASLVLGGCCVLKNTCNPDFIKPYLPIFGLFVPQPYFNIVSTAFYTWFAVKEGLPVPSSSLAPETIPNQTKFGMAIGAFVRLPNTNAAEADLTQPQVWRKSSTEMTQVKLTIVLTETALVAVAAQDDSRPIQLDKTFFVGQTNYNKRPVGVTPFPIPKDGQVDDNVINISPVNPKELLQVYVFPCRVSNSKSAYRLAVGEKEWINFQLQLPSTPPQFALSQPNDCPVNPSAINWKSIYSNAKPLVISKNNKSLYGTVDQVEKGQWYKLDIPYSTGL